MNIRELADEIERRALLTGDLVSWKEGSSPELADCIVDESGYVIAEHCPVTSYLELVSPKNLIAIINRNKMLEENMLKVASMLGESHEILGKCALTMAEAKKIISNSDEFKKAARRKERSNENSL